MSDAGNEEGGTALMWAVRFTVTLASGETAFENGALNVNAKGYKPVNGIDCGCHEMGHSEVVKTASGKGG